MPSDGWSDTLEHIKKETLAVRLCELAIKSDADEIRSILEKQPQLLNKSAQYLASIQHTAAPQPFGGIKERIKDYHCALSWLWGEWHLQLVRQTFNKHTITFQNNSKHGVMLMFTQIAMHMRSMKILRQGRMKMDATMTPLVVAICTQNRSLVKTLLDLGYTVSLYEIVLCIRQGDLKVFLEVCSRYNTQKQSKWSFTKKRIVKTFDMDTDEQVFSPELKQQLSILLQTQFLNRPLIDFLFQWNRKEILEAVFPQLDLPLTPAPTSTDLSSLESLFQCCDLSVIRLVLRQQPQLANQPVSSVSLLYPIHIAAMHLRLDLMQFLITECQVNVNQTDGLSKTALHHAISAITKFSRPHVSPLVLIHKLDHFTPIAYLLVESGALLNHVDHQGTFPLQLLLSGWYGQDMIDDHPWLPELVGYMVQSGANVNTPTKYNETLLHVCARQKLYLCALVLTSHGAWIRPNKTGKLPGDICRDYVQRPLFHALQTKLPSLGYLSKVALTRNKPLPPFILK